MRIGIRELVVAGCVILSGWGWGAEPPSGPRPVAPAASKGLTQTLREAVEAGNLAQVRAQVEAGGDLNALDEGLAPLHRAVLSGQADVVSYLVERGANVNVRCQLGRTPLHYAVAQNQMGMVRFLLSHGADVKARDQDGVGMLEFSGSSASKDTPTEVQPGLVVCIDTKTTGGLVVSSKAYDRTVAGVISGAGGIQAGMRMGQDGSIATGGHPVALTGRVFCWADASCVPIRPGDLLTTSNQPGHAMRVTDFNRSHGAVIGKAMTGLEKGRGLVLMLVALE
ncbi:MAG TPA: ankyrin repeat domain-containing protein [Candidatus Sumerlaeota bacterium]|nr:ankyrin repeat domain-containing protein [Candidatus Sumerlaeota bacterium]